MEASSHMLLYIVHGRFPWEEASSSSAASSSYSASCVELDPDVWSKLPDEILDRVLMVLPYPSQLRFRTVAKCWQSRLSSLNFQRRSAALALPPPLMVCAFEYRHATARNEKPAYGGKPLWRKTGCKAHKVDLSHLPPKMQKWRSKRTVANDGLICVEFYQKRRVNENGRDRLETAVAYIVLNPVTRSWKEVPELDINNQVSATMQVVADKTDAGYFTVFVVCTSEKRGRKKCTINAYSSRTNTWTSMPGQLAPVYYYTWCHCVFVDQVLYSFEVEEMMLLSLGDGKLVKHGKVGWPVPDFEGNNFHLLHHNGSVYFAGQTYHGNDPWFLVWKLDVGRMAWDIVSEMPEWIHDRLVKPTRLNKLSDCTFCVGDAYVVGDFIYFILGIQSIPSYGSWSPFGTAAKIDSWSHVITFNILDERWGLSFERISDLVCKTYTDPCGFLVPNYNMLI